MRIATLSLLVLCLALTASAQKNNVFSEGPIDGNDNGLFVTGPLYPNFVGSFQDISNDFIAACTVCSIDEIKWGEWSVGAPTSFAWSLSTDAGGAFGNNLGSGTVGQNAGNSTLLFTNAFGYGVYSVDVSIPKTLVTNGNTYWFSISNATDGASDGTQGWDIPNAGLGGPATCNFRQSGTNFGNCGFGGESFTLNNHQNGTTPEPSSIMLLGS